MTTRQQLKCERTEWYPGMVCLDLTPDSPRITVPVNGERMIFVITSDMTPQFPVPVEMVFQKARSHGPKDRMLFENLADAALCVDAAILHMIEASDAS